MNMNVKPEPPVLGSKVAILVGGPADGRRIDLPCDQLGRPLERVSVAVPGLEEGSVEHEVYKSRRVVENGFEYWLYVYESDGRHNTMLALLTGYRKEVA